ncbi:MAG: prepilin-type N-terminal cleavage/methylation domain-containing protein [Thermoanaerobaculia bacterium]
MSARPSRRARGVSLVEMLVVMAIGMTVILVLLPITLGLLREGKNLSGEALTSETLPHLHERLAQDLLAAGGAVVLPYPLDGSPTAQLTLTPPRIEDPTVVYDFSPALIRRSVRAADPDAPPPARPQTWSIPGSLTVLEDELVQGRLGLRFQPARGPAEILVFALPGTLPGVRERS